MSRLDFLYRQELPHRAVSVYTYLADRANKDGECWPAIPTIASESVTSKKQSFSKPNSDIAPKAVRAVCFTKYEADNALKNLHLPPRGYYTFSVAGGTCHDDRRKRTTHSKRYYSRIEKR